MELSSSFLAQALPEAQYYNDGVINQYCNNASNTFFAIDTRALQRGDFFIAFPGQQVDGHNYVSQAIEKGASGLIIQNKECLKDIDTTWLLQHPVIIVPDTHKALIALAIAWRKLLSMPIIGVTGSVGKTTTKEMIRAMLMQAGKKAYVTHKNQNTDIGVSLNILRTPLDCDVAVYEMGINETGEMAELVSIVKPTIAVITAIAYVHAQGLGTLSDVGYEKRQIFSQFSGENIGVINGDTRFLDEISYQHPVARFGLKTKNQVQARKIKSIQSDNNEIITEFTLKWFNQKRQVRLKGNHLGYVRNALAASTIGYLLEISLDDIVTALESYKGFEGRFEVKPLKDGNGTLINDCYNASPESMKVALQAFDQLPTQGKKIAVLGDMLELGERERYWHRQIGRMLAKSNSIDTVILVGNRSREIAHTAPSTLSVSMTADWKGAINILNGQVSKGCIVLVKASLGMQLKHVVKAFVK